MNTVIRRALADDFQVVADTGRATFYETWRDYNTEEDMRIYLAEAFDPGKIRKDLLNDQVNTFYLAERDGKTLGYAKLRNDRSYDEFKGQSALEIERIYVFREFHGDGIGQALLDEAFRQAEAEKRKWIWLGVNIDNHRAIRFYQKNGFEIFGSKMFKLGDAEDKDHLMKRPV